MSCEASVLAFQRGLVSHWSPGCEVWGMTSWVSHVLSDESRFPSWGGHLSAVSSQPHSTTSLGSLGPAPTGPLELSRGDSFWLTESGDKGKSAQGGHPGAPQTLCAGHCGCSHHQSKMRPQGACVPDCEESSTHRSFLPTLPSIFLTKFHFFQVPPPPSGSPCASGTAPKGALIGAG